MTTFAQLSARLKNFLRGWLLVLGLKEGLAECATVCVKSVVILIYPGAEFNATWENLENLVKWPEANKALKCVKMSV